MSKENNWLLVYLFLMINLGYSANAQWSVEGAIHYGRVFKHSPKLTFDVTENTPGFEVNFKYQTTGKRPWHSLKRFPQFGVALLYHRIGDPKTLGNAFSLLPNITTYLKRKPNMDIYLQYGAGPGYISSIYNPISNPLHNAIGSHLNIAVQFELGLDFQLNPNWQLNTGLSFTHWSNGAAQLPNYGINIPSIMVGTRYTPVPADKTIISEYKTDIPETDRWGGHFQLALAFRERNVFGGPRYPIYIGSVGAHYYLNKVNRLIAGLEFEWNKGVYVFGKHVYEFNSEKEAQRRSGRVLFFVADEFLFGDLGVSIQAGINLTGNAYLVPLFLYNKLHVKYYLPPVGNTRFYVGAHLKSHIIIAEYFAVGVGAAFR